MTHVAVVLVPIVVFALSRFVAHDQALLIGVLLVLLTPCVDYVMVFSALAGAAHERLLAAAPLLMLLQLLLLPLYLVVLVGRDMADVVEIAPFVEAFVVLIAIPLAAAAAIQWLSSRHRAGVAIMTTMSAAMVPLMMLTLALVVASQARAVGNEISSLVRVVPIYVAFLAIMAPLGKFAARAAKLDTPASRALTFSGATRNSLVVLPLAIALPSALSLAPLVVVTQTLVELIGMVVYVQLIPRMIPDDPSAKGVTRRARR